MKIRVASTIAVGVLLGLAMTAPALAQGEAETRPAGATFLGDTGFWFVPTAEVIGSGGFSLSVQSVETNRENGFSNIRHGVVTAATGIGDRVEVFGSMRILTRIDRDARPLFMPTDMQGEPHFGGLLNDYPLVTDPFTGNQRGDLVAGIKINLLSEERLDPVALAIRGYAKLPTGNTDAGASTGEADGEIDIVLSKIVGNVELAGFAGFLLRRDPADVEISNSGRWGVGLGAPVRGPLQFFAELTGELYPSNDRVIQRGRVGLAGADGSLAGTWTRLYNPIDLNLGLNWHGPGGIFASVGMNWALAHDDRSVVNQPSHGGDRLGLLLRVGYHSGVRLRMPPPVEPPPPPPPPPPANRPPTVSIECDPCEVGVGEEIELRADARDPDGDTLTYRWNSPAGELTGAGNQATQRWRAPDQGGPVPVTVTVSDGRGGSVSDTVTVQVNEPPAAPPRELVFEDVHFDFDQSNLRPAATRLLDEAYDELRADPDLRLQIDGHTCNIGTPEYNLALGDRRANAVREYLVGRGISESRLSTVSYGEERPAHDNAEEETRQYNRRAVLVVEFQ